MLEVAWIRGLGEKCIAMFVFDPGFRGVHGTRREHEAHDRDQDRT